MNDLTKSGVYTIYNITNNKQYIGSTTMSFKKRWNHHQSLLRRNKHKNEHLQRAWNKHGEKSFIFKILEYCNGIECFEKEQMYLDELCNLYNINPMATGTPLQVKEARIKQSISMKKYWSINGTDILKGRLPWNKGLKMPKEHCLKLKDSAKNRIQTKEGLEKRKLKMAKHAKQVIQYDLNYNFIKIWDNANSFSKSNPDYRSNGVRSCCNGTYKCGYYKEYIFKYYNNTAHIDSNIYVKSDELGETLSQNFDMTIPNQANSTLLEGVTTTGVVQST